MSKDWKAFERSIAKAFTEVYYPVGDGEFRRTSAFTQSGGFGKDMVCGDLVALKYGVESNVYIDKTFPFSIECKNWKEENVKHFFSGLYSQESVIFSWMQQAYVDSARFNKIPLVAFRLFRQKSVALLQSTDFSKLKEMFGEPETKYYFLCRLGLTAEEQVLYRNRLVFILLKDFINWIDWEVYKFSNRRFIKSLIKKGELTDDDS